VISGTTVVSNGAMEINNYGVLELNGGGKLEVSGSLTNAGTLNIVVQADGVNSGVVISDGATFVNSGTIVMSAGSLAEGQSVTVFADVLGNGILDSTGTVQGTGTIKVFGGTYADGIFTAGTKSEVNAGEQLGGNQGSGDGDDVAGGGHGGHHVKPGESVEIKDKHHHDKHGRHHAVYLAAGHNIIVHQVDNLDHETIRHGDKDHEIGASWDFDIEKENDTEVFVQMYIGEGLSLDTIKIFHKDDGKEDWDDFTETVGYLSYDSKTGLLSFTTTDFSSYAVSGIHSSVAIPEPSAFGLLAGLGAIALAVSRRRRSRR
ncbi:MAG: PEP-CTERM sorting domain-containing protein, partial [Opitutales bacterium]|nr:PEP-CTERM sorting domain-containing protein [Opitutales bacterium]